MEVHADILRMAGSEEKRERIKWYYARSVFFGDTTGAFAEGLELAKQCQHEDARYLVSLFPKGPPHSKAKAKKVFLGRGEEPHCLCWAGFFCSQNDFARWQLLKRSAEAGYSWGQMLLSFARFGSPKIELLQMAASQGEPEAMWRLAKEPVGRMGLAEFSLPDEACAEGSQQRRLWHEAALLGDAWAQFMFSVNFCGNHSLERLEWLRRSACQVKGHGLRNLSETAGRLLKQRNEQGNGRMLFEIGRAFVSTKQTPQGFSKENMNDMRRTVHLYKECIALAKSAVMCWLWVSKRLGMPRDVRMMIARPMCEDRAVWSERADVVLDVVSDDSRQCLIS